MTDYKAVKDEFEPLIKGIAEYIKNAHGAPGPGDTQTKGLLCDLTCAGGCAAICAIGGAVASGLGAAGGKALADEYVS